MRLYSIGWYLVQEFEFKTSLERVGLGQLAISSCPGNLTTTTTAIHMVAVLIVIILFFRESLNMNCLMSSAILSKDLNDLIRFCLDVHFFLRGLSITSSKNGLCYVIFLKKTFVSSRVSLLHLSFTYIFLNTFSS